MGKTINSGIGIGVGSSAQESSVQNELDRKIQELTHNDSKSFNPSKFYYEDSESKYDTYLLNLNHESGRSKAKFLKEVLGYEKGDGKKLHEAIAKAINGKTPELIEETPYGIKHRYKIKLSGKDGKSHFANVVVIVQNDKNKTTWRLITLRPDKKEK